MVQTFLVTGSSGLVGSALQHVVSKSGVIDKKQNWIFLKREDGNLLSQKVVKDLLCKWNPTHVIHLAARVGGLFDNVKNNLEFLNENIAMNTNVLTASHVNPHVKKVISCMSTCIFPDKNVKYPLTVDQLHNGLPHHSNIGYAYAKRLIDVQNKILFTKDKPFIAVIPTNIFGPDDNFNIDHGHVIPSLIHKCYNAKHAGLPFVVRGSGNAKRQFLYSSDLAKIILVMAGDYDKPEPVIVSPQEEFTIRHVAEKIANIMEFKGEIRFQEQDDEGQFEKTVDGSAIHKIVSNFEFTDLDKALNETINWFINAKERNDGSLRQ